MAANDTKSCPLSQQELIDEYFMESRTKILDIAAFLDRLDRSVSPDGEDDFRIAAMKSAMLELNSQVPGRIERVLMIFSDQNTELLDELDRKAAYGASIR
ncbi:MAG TPA: hypothetical protein VNZ58_01010 [Thermomicrobiales bacterium]|nr:hypothetical protein [Thermomicrobiales bacterium]